MQNSKIQGNVLHDTEIRLTPVPVRVGGLSSFVEDLNGEWEFSRSVPFDFPSENQQVIHDWTRVSVPGQVQQQGIFISRESLAAYRRTFTVPKEWHGMRIQFKCDHYNGRGAVYVNRQPCGEHDLYHQ